MYFLDNFLISSLYAFTVPTWPVVVNGLVGKKEPVTSFTIKWVSNVPDGSESYPKPPSFIFIDVICPISVDVAVTSPPVPAVLVIVTTGNLVYPPPGSVMTILEIEPSVSAAPASIWNLSLSEPIISCCLVVCSVRN